MTAGTVHVVLPGDVDDPATPSGGNRYDRRLCEHLPAAGWTVRELAVPGAWPDPDPADRAALAKALATVPDGGVVLIDGLVGCAAPEQLEPDARRLRTVALVHLPLAAETGLPPATQATLDQRERRALHTVTAVLATSSAAGRDLVHRHELPPARVRVAEPGVDPAPPVTGSDGGARLLSVAAVTPRKGHDLLVEALAELPDLDWTWIVVGALDRAPEFVDRVRGLVHDRGLDARVRLIGPRTGHELAACYAAVDLLVLPSRAETYGMVVTEALARGVPVLATAVGGVPDALGRSRDGSPPGSLDGDLPGLLVPPDDPAALTAALRGWLTDPTLRGRLRAAALDRRAQLTGWEITARRVAAVLDDVRSSR